MVAVSVACQQAGTRTTGDGECRKVVGTSSVRDGRGGIKEDSQERGVYRGVAFGGH